MQLISTRYGGGSWVVIAMLWDSVEQQCRCTSVTVWNMMTLFCSILRMPPAWCRHLAAARQAGDGN